MKISFVVGGLPMNPISTLEEIRKYDDIPGVMTFSDENYWKIRCLEINTDFEKEIIRARKSLGIPNEGLSYSNYLSSYNPILSYQKSESDLKVNKEISNILENFICDEYVEYQLKSILLANIVLPTEPNGGRRKGLSVQSVFNEEDLDREENQSHDKAAVYIKVTSSVKPEAIIEFIKERRETLTTLLKNLPKGRKYELSEEKIKIYGMKKNSKNVSYDEMAAIMSKSGKEEDNKIADTLGQDYRRTIKRLFYKKRQKITR